MGACRVFDFYEKMGADAVFSSFFSCRAPFRAPAPSLGSYPCRGLCCGLCCGLWVAMGSGQGGAFCDPFLSLGSVPGREGLFL